jgi:branched-chain amino acid aminotransferase
MLAYLNGQFVAADRPALPLNDRSFLYGDGIFETIRITNGQPFLWREHLERLQRGAAFLKIPFAHSSFEMEQATRHLLAQNDTPEGMARIHLSRGPSERGYSTKTATTPTLVITTHKTFHPEPRPLRVITSTIRVLAGDPLAQHKTANRLPNILARQEADQAAADEAIILNHRDEVVGASAANIFVLRGNNLITPPLTSGGLAGTTRAFVQKSAASAGVTSSEEPFTIGDIEEADAVFLTSAHWLVAVLGAFNDRSFDQPPPAILKLQSLIQSAARGVGSV